MGCWFSRARGISYNIPFPNGVVVEFAVVAGCFRYGKSVYILEFDIGIWLGRTLREEERGMASVKPNKLSSAVSQRVWT